MNNDQTISFKSQEWLPQKDLCEFSSETKIICGITRFGHYSVGLINGKISNPQDLRFFNQKYKKLIKEYNLQFKIDYLILFIHNFPLGEKYTSIFQLNKCFNIMFWDTNHFRVNRLRISNPDAFKSALIKLGSSENNNKNYLQFLVSVLKKNFLNNILQQFGKITILLQMIKSIIFIIINGYHEIDIDLSKYDSYFINKKMDNVTISEVPLKKAVKAQLTSYSFYWKPQQVDIVKLVEYIAKGYGGNIGSDFYNFIFQEIIIPLRDHTSSVYLDEFSSMLGINLADIIKNQSDYYSDNELNTGTIYTPSQVSNFMISRFVKYQKNPDNLDDMKILDLCCGTGNFTLEILYHFYQILKNGFNSETTNKEKIFDMLLKVLKTQIISVDIDYDAIFICRLRVIMYLKQIGPTQLISDQILMKTVEKRILREDGLNLDLKSHFPVGINAVVCNPPYIQEKNNKTLFDRIISENPQLNDFYMPRINLYLLFLGRALQLVNDNGVLCFITPNYFLKNMNARKIREFLWNTTNRFEIYDFENIKLFQNAPGQHIAVYLMTKNENPNVGDCRNRNFTSFRVNTENPRFMQTLSAYNAGTLDFKDIFTKSAENYINVFSPKTGFILNYGAKEETKEMMLRIEKNSLCLSDICTIKQGVIAGPDRVSAKKIKKLNNALSNDISAGDPVFILPETLIEKIKLTKFEKSLLLPFFYVRDLGKPIYRKSDRNNLDINNRIIYTDRETTLSKQKHPNLMGYLARFKPIMDERRENRQGRIRWYHLHWPRKKSLFTEVRLISVRMTEEPRFIFSEIPFVTDLATNIIQSDSTTLKFLYLVLNSQVCKRWYEYNAKRKGRTYQIDKKVLEHTPVPNFDKDIISVYAWIFDYVGLDRDSEIQRHVEKMIEAQYMGRKSNKFDVFREFIRQDVGNRLKTINSGKRRELIQSLNDSEEYL